jgi:hypothetical protein
VRAFYLAMILVLTGFTLFNLFQFHSSGIYTSTIFTHIFFFSFLLLPSSVIFIFYILHGNPTTTTIIPCLTSTWYKSYTAVVFLGMLVLFILSAIETKKTWCGLWTTYPPRLRNGTHFNFPACPQTRVIESKELSLSWNNGTSNRTLFLDDFNGFLTGTWSNG